MIQSCDLVLRSDRVVLPDGVRPATVHVRGGRIAAIEERSSSAMTGRELDAGSLVVMPGLVDTHVHINEPGRTEWEGFDSGTRAAAAGGVTTIVDMPLNSVPPTTSVEGLTAKVGATEGSCHVDVGLWGGIVAGNPRELEKLASAGVLGFKCFLCPSGVEEFAHVSEADLRQALPIVAQLGIPLLVHAELPRHLRSPEGDRRRYATWLHSRPVEAEHAAIELLIRLAGEFGVHVHVVHLASADALPLFASARASGLPITVETCPHYLTFAADEIADGATLFKCAPPIREASHRERLWQALEDGTIDMIATDHSPAPPALKRTADGDFLEAWGGIASLQLGLGAVWTGAARRGVPLWRIARWMCENPARLAGLQARKGRIAKGLDADFVIWDPDAEVTVDAKTLHHRHRLTPYDGVRLRGSVVTTILRGEVIVEGGRCSAERRGQLLRGADIESPSR